ncbi:3-hydroxyisobutyrate dehydrogenase-like beta-hydroxyacid dehydrogenase [Nonomuraea thailandensis]|uniref:3-hydroxyisobutyrate dehydrogenase-like beta-hydroxyacid dehydrogenase n=1 Tax=Nonomuraea thailandensis TaxID=1188745 RepID=A0A9X2K8X5_9ACTN|nr:NAD(P)-binding domain-containing protein [Nonomuraea thailandensis]MCP2364029.1 3-hydroxyisobutyrate dehydrogenase-like beta-hydroxyacid dehydrogenase [Nonomuraea thailandensis]
MNTQRIGILGLGAMGRALASALLGAGREVTVWNRTPGKADGLGAREASSVEEAIESSDLTVVCLLNDASVRETLAPVAPKLDGATLVNLTSGSARQARELDGRLAGHGARLLAGGIMAVPPTVGTDGAFILYSGERELFDRVAPALAPIGRPHWVGADPGFAALYDMAALSGMYGMSAGADHAVTMVHREGGDVEAFKREVLQPWLEQMLPFMVSGADVSDFVPEEYNPAMQATGLENILAASEEADVPDDLAGHLRASLWRMRRAAA